MKRASWAPPLTAGLLARRAAALALVALVAFSLFLSQPMPMRRALALSLIVSALYGLLLLSLEYLPESVDLETQEEGRVLPGRWRRPR